MLGDHEQEEKLYKDRVLMALEAIAMSLRDQTELMKTKHAMLHELTKKEKGDTCNENRN